MTTMIVNGTRVRVAGPPTRTLLDVLRSELGLTGTKRGCGVGECGSCTVLVGDRPVLACLRMVATVHEPVRTIEDLGPELAGLREAFADEGGFQCGFCTPGQLVQAGAVLAEDPARAAADEQWVRQRMTGNVCRCTGYAGIVRAVQRCALQCLTARVPAPENDTTTISNEGEGAR